MMVPHIFTGKREPWKGLLLYGPPGTGKTFLAKAAASQCDCTFFSISSSNLMSKWLGESERLVRNLFEMARECAPAIVFVDEVDSLCSARDDSGGSDATHRVLTEFLAQMDGVGQDKGERVLVLGATNLPWALDPAIRRRFERRIYIPLPDATARRSMFDIHMGDHPHTLTEADWQELVPRTELYSGADIRNLCRAALMQGVASIEAATHFREVRSQDPANRQGALLEPCAPSHPGASPMDFADMSPSDLRRLVPPPVTKEDFLGHVQGMGSVTADQIQKFEEFTNKFGSGKPRA
uniref:AAA+ ATPase domain-containing protein n=1 Tax=Eutreptiella gymnastica TaxID=73025 RepID=A0A7S4FZZ8_9EUGL|mmetsp:Transcript_50962/g.85198  ORF Transcript_50962/g.85198 Transcript_50962/m.85198 type:complete len:295 (-) Transcript_50962:24-908(-)